MSSLELDIDDGGDGDLLVRNNALHLTEGKAAIRQHLQVKFGIFMNEWFLDNNVGVPYYEDILIKNPAYVVVQEDMKSEALDTPGVTTLEKFELEYNSADRLASVTLEADTIDGPIDFTKEIPVI